MQLEGQVAQPQVQQDSDGVAQDLAQRAAAEMPEVARSDHLGREALRQLAEDGVDVIANPGEQAASPWAGILSGGAVGRQRLHLCRAHLLGQAWRLPVAVAYRPA